MTTAPATGIRGCGELRLRVQPRDRGEVLPGTTAFLYGVPGTQQIMGAQEAVRWTLVLSVFCPAINTNDGGAALTNITFHEDILA